jgi:uncharacterized protein (TIGR02117 family)
MSYTRSSSPNLAILYWPPMRALGAAGLDTPGMPMMRTKLGNGSQRLRRILRNTLALSLAIPLLYLVAALLGAVIPRNSASQQSSGEIVIFVRSNGVHSDLVLPAQAHGFDLYSLMPTAHTDDPAAAGGWLALGWGQRELYLETPRWRDLRLRNAIRPIFGGDALMHVEHVAPPSASTDTRPVRLDSQAYARLVAAATGDFVIGDQGQPIPLVGKGYAENDVFYEATGRYSALRTSNQWTADALADAGVRVGVWTPFVQSIMWRFRCVDER